MRKFTRYKENLKYDNTHVYSYNTKVGRIDGDRLIVDRYYSVITSKHIFYAASELNLRVIKTY